MADFRTFDAAKAAFAKYDFPLSENAYQKLHSYAQLMIDESQRQNITAVKEYNEIWGRHFLDLVHLLRFLPNEPKFVLDIGTGGGIPGIPLAILKPQLQVTLLDSEERKIDFCRRVVDSLSISASCLCGRAEELAQRSEYRAKFDFAVSRAMANGSMLTELAVPFLKIGGRLIAMKGRNYDPAVERFSEAADAVSAKCSDTISYQLEGEQKYLILVDKESETPLQYPRRFAKIKRNPL